MAAALNIYLHGVAFAWRCVRSAAEGELFFPRVARAPMPLEADIRRRDASVVAAVARRRWFMRFLFRTLYCFHILAALGHFLSLHYRQYAATATDCFRMFG